MNIDFEKSNNRFQSRASAIIYNENKDKILLFKVDDGRDYYMLPGGRIEFNEDSIHAIKREIYEELGLDLEFELCSIQENFVKKDDNNITQYCFCFKSTYRGKVANDPIPCKDNNGQFFYWVDINDLDKIKIVPTSTYDLVKAESNTVIHIIEKSNQKNEIF